MRRVVVTGVGAITPLGVGAKTSWANLLANRSGIRALDSRFDALPSRVAGLVLPGKKATGGWDASEWLSNDEQRRMALFAQYAVAAAQEAVDDSGLNLVTASNETREAIGVCVGSGIGAFSDVYDTSVAFSNGGYKKVSPLFVPRLLINLAAGHIAMRWGLQGPNTSPTTACTTGAHAIGDAARMIVYGDADVMLAGAAESCIHPLAVAGFARARSLSTGWNEEPEKASRPFDQGRDGFVIGEGAGILVLEELEHAQDRGANIYAELRGYGLSCDASHMTAPLEDGHGAYLAMRRAIANAAGPLCAYPSIDRMKFLPHVDYINAHATSTSLGDIAEIRAIRHLLNTHPPQIDPHEVRRRSAVQGGPITHVSSTKGSIGHLLGASGAVEAIFTVLALRHFIIPPTLNLDNIDEDIRSVLKSSTGRYHSRADRETRIRLVNHAASHVSEDQMQVALSNSFGFGGTNASLCFGAVHDSERFSD